MLAEYGVLNYWTYLVGAILTVSAPGPGTLFVLRNSVSSGVKGGYLTTCGVFTGDTILMLLTWAGVATLTRTAPVLFDIVRYFGAFYLLYLGSRTLYATLKGKNSEAKPDESQYGAIFKRALILSLTNPKAILFYVSFLVQSTDVSAPYTGISFSILAAMLELVSFCYLNFLTISGVFATQYIRTKKKLAKVGSSPIGLTFMDFTIRLATLQS